MSGYTFTYEVASEGLKSGITVPNGWWALDLVCGMKSAKPMGIEIVNCGGSYSQVSARLLHACDPDMGRFILASRRPFGVIGEGLSSVFFRWDDQAPRFRSARQIHKGELGQHVPVPNLQVIQTLSRRLGSRDETHHWASLAEVLLHTDLELMEFVEIYGRFGDGVIGRCALVNLLVTDDPASVNPECGHYHGWKMYTAEQFADHASGARLSDVWISARFARTALRLHTLGYTPVQAQTT